MTRSKGLRDAIQDDLEKQKKTLVTTRDMVQKVVDRAEAGSWHVIKQNIIFFFIVPIGPCITTYMYIFKNSKYNIIFLNITQDLG